MVGAGLAVQWREDGWPLAEADLVALAQGVELHCSAVQKCAVRA